jgi:glutamate carboxypeptidase
MAPHDPTTSSLASAPTPRPDEATFLRVREGLLARRDELIATIARLVEQGSYTGDREGGARVGAMLAELATDAGLGVRMVPSERFAPHLVARSPAASASAEGAVAIVGHLDTVFPPGTFEGFRRDGDTLLRGPGVLDMKGGLVCALEAVRVVRELGLLPRLAVRFSIVSDEEVGSPEGQPLLRDELGGASCALVLEAGRKGDAIITRRKGTGSVRAEARGKAAHAGNDHASGANAIWALARFVDGAQGLTDYAEGVTVNVGTVQGGQSKNTVPDQALATADFRFERVEQGERLFARLRELAAACASSVPGTSLDLSGGIGRLPLERTPASLALFHEYAAHAAAAGLGSSEAGLIAGGSDASTTSAHGVPSIDGLGPRGSGFHTRDELVEVSSLVPKIEAMVRFLVTRALAGG